MILPPEAHPLVQVRAPHFTNPTYQRFAALMVGAVLATGRRYHVSLALMLFRSRPYRGRGHAALQLVSARADRSPSPRW